MALRRSGRDDVGLRGTQGAAGRQPSVPPHCCRARAHQGCSAAREVPLGYQGALLQADHTQVTRTCFERSNSPELTTLSADLARPARQKSAILWRMGPF